MAPFYSKENYKPYESLGYLISGLASALATSLERDLKETGITAAQWKILSALHFAGRVIKASEIGALFRTDKGTVSRLIDKLEGKGFVLRERAASDRRSQILSLTDSGEAMCRDLPAYVSANLNRFLVDFTDAEFLELTRLLRKMLANAPAHGMAEDIENESPKR